MEKLKKAFQNLNSKYLDEYNKYKKIIKDKLLVFKKKDSENLKDIEKYLVKTGDLLVYLSDLEAELNEDFFNENDLEYLLKENNQYFSEIKEENYKTSYVNPEYSVSVFGNEIGQLLSFFYYEVFLQRDKAFFHSISELTIIMKSYIEFSDYLETGNFDFKEIKNILTAVKNEPDLERSITYKKIDFSEEFDYFRNLITDSDLTDLRYLFKFGKHITKNEIETAQFLNEYPKDKLKVLAASISEAYKRGFENDNKDLSIKDTVMVVHNIGQEVILKELISNLSDMGLTSLITRFMTTSANKQASYDHKFDNSLYFSKEYSEKFLKVESEAFEITKEMLDKLSGPIFFDKFGEKPFAPKNKKERLTLSEEQHKTMMFHQSEIGKLKAKYIPRSKTSFTIVGFPVPEIGSNFKEIFAETVKINMLDNNKFEEIQQFIIDVLDKAAYVRVLGEGENQTDIKVKMQELKKPEKETNFVNCVADVNIPVGEVFTSPQLKGTTGLLHVTEVFLGNLRYDNLKLDFKDGFVDSYSCTNFSDENENKKYIEDNLLFPHKTLPLGEFAIGTNTFAYVFANKYNIVHLLPILIEEKMGPHFAIGDTCFTWEEDRPVFNPDGKEITARWNEKTIKRKEDVGAAYTNVHTDITIPYNEIKLISAVLPDGEEIDVIRDGKFVLKGTDYLNTAFSEE